MATAPAVASIRSARLVTQKTSSVTPPLAAVEASSGDGDEEPSEPPSCGPQKAAPQSDARAAAPSGALGANSYLSPKCEVLLTNDRGGHTVVAVEPIRKGELIVIWSGTVMSGEELMTLPASVRRYSLQVEEDHYLVSVSDCEPPDYVNHSCEPNAGLSGQLALVALRDIGPGEEISYDYAMSDGSSYDEFRCGCGSPMCRGAITGDDWRRPELWVRYQGHFSPYLQRRIQRLRRRLAAKSVSQRVTARLSGSVIAAE